MSRVHYSFDAAVAAAAAAPDAKAPILRAARRPKPPSRTYLRRATENLGLFAFGFGATNLLIHFAVGFFYALRMSSMVSQFNL